jgi:Ohr subfamily peroxiredoxin
MPEKILYTAEAKSTGDGRDGHVTSSDGRIDLDLATPAEMGGSGAGAGANPEELFAAGYAACYHSELRAIARQTGVSAEGSTVTAYVGIGPEGDAFDLVVTLEIYLPDAGPQEARELAAAAHQACPYSRATRGNISVELRLAGPAATTEQPA